MESSGIQMLKGPKYIVCYAGSVLQEKVVVKIFGRVRDNPNVVETLEEGNGMPIEERVFQSGSTAEDISLVRDMGFDVDDDNSPDPANIPNAESNSEDHVPPEWEWSGIFPRKQNGCRDYKATMGDLTPEKWGVMGMYFSNSSLKYM